MPILQVRELPAEIYASLSRLAQSEHRSLAQQTIVLLEEAIAARMPGRSRRRIVLEGYSGLGLEGKDLPDPVDLVREDRER